MSMIVDAIEAFDTGERKFISQKTSRLFQDVFDAKSTWEDVKDPYICKIYSIGVKLGSKVMVEEHPNKNYEDELADAVDRTKKQIIEAIFGEFRTNFREIEKALYNFDYETARVLLRRFEEQMFKVTV